MPDPFFLDEAVRAAVRHEMAIAKAKYGEDHFEVICIEGSRGDTLDDRQTLRLLRALNRTGSMVQEFIRQI
jgi:hypothetical protein